jgi:DNA repair protein RadC
MLIKEMAKEERPRERLLKYGKENVSNSDLLSIILKTGTKGESVSALANRLLNSLDDFIALKNINIQSLIKIRGIGEAKAIEILSSIELGRRLYLIKGNSKQKLINSKDVYDYNKYLFDDKKQEYFYCVYLDSKKQIIDRKLLFIGTINKSLVHPREIFKEAYLLSASSIICMHNHPSGDIMPSQDDLSFTESIIKIGRLQQIPIVDHIIFGDNKYYSYYENI